MREIPEASHKGKTKNKILNTATELFALKGYSAVTMEEISLAVGIKASSIYSHYKSKDALMSDILARFEKGYRNYFDWLSEQNKKAESLEELMDNMFNQEFLGFHDPVGHLGLSFVLKEQHNSELARNMVFELFHKFSISRLQEDFDRLVEKNIIPPTDTKSIATIFILCVMSGCDLRVHELSGYQPDIDCTQTYIGLKDLFTKVLASKKNTP